MNARQNIFHATALNISAVITLVICLTVFFGWDFHLLKLLELKSYDFRFRWRGPESPSGKVVIVAIDEKSIEHIGRWPWSRSVHAELIVRLHEAGAKAIGFDILTTEPELNPERETVNSIRRRFIELDLLRPDKNNQVFLEEITDAANQMDSDTILAGVAKEAGNVVFATAFVPSSEVPKDLPPYLLKAAYKNSYRKDAGRGGFDFTRYNGALVPTPVLGNAASGIGFVNSIPDIDGALRRALMVVEHGGVFFSPFGVQLVRQYEMLDNQAISLNSDKGVEVGPYRVSIENHGMSYVNHLGPACTIPIYSYIDVMNQQIDPKLLAGKIVIVGGTYVGLGDLWPNPFSESLWGVEYQATIVENILNGSFIKRPEWAIYVDIAVIVLIGMVLGMVLPLLKGLWPIFFMALIAALFCVANQVVFFRYKIWFSFVYPILEIGAVYTGVFAHKYLTVERQKRMIRTAFQQYLHPSVVERVLKNPDMLRLGGQKKTLTILFSDIRGFTSISEKLSPEQLVHLLNEYLDSMSEKIFSFNGTLDKFMGDAIMAFFGAPVAQEDHAALACRSALAMADTLKTLQDGWTDSGFPLIKIGIGINTGAVVVGNMGSRQRFDYTVMGDHVNLSSRLEGQTKHYGVQIIVGENTYNETKDIFYFRLLDLIRVKGKVEATRIYELIGEKAAGTQVPTHVTLYEQAFEAYLNGDFQSAGALLEQVLQCAPHDGPAEVLMKRCDEMIEVPPPSDWDGVAVKLDK